MEIQKEDNSKKGRFFVEEDKQTLAEMTYVWSGADKIIIDHTEVNEKLKGQSIGKQMLAKAVAFARQNHLKIMPLCPFAQSVFDKEESYQDVLF
jgi:predicted GNAT family acetyltransferase